MNTKTIKTNIGTLGYNHLYEPTTFKTNTNNEDTKTKTKEEKTARPKYSAKLIFDKTTNAEAIKKLEETQNAIIKEMKDRRKFKRGADTLLAFKDCDETEVQLQDGTYALMSENNETLKNKWILSADSYDRPDMRYLDDHYVFQPMPQPILHPTESNEEKAAEIQTFWREKVFAGQNAVFAIRMYGWASPLGQGIKAELKVVTIMGGGKPLGEISFEDAFSKEEQEELIAWAREHKAKLRREQDWNGSATVDEATGEVAEQADDAYETEETKPRKHRQSVKVAVEPVDDEEDVDII